MRIHLNRPNCIIYKGYLGKPLTMYYNLQVTTPPIFLKTIPPPHV